MAQNPLQGKENELDAAIERAVERGLSARTQALLDAAESPHTVETYSRYWELFEHFCADYGGRGPDGVRRKGLSAMPATSPTMAEFVGYLAHRGYAPKTIRVALATVRRRHRVEGHPAPDCTQANAAVRGYQGVLLQQGWRPKRAAPARTSELEKVVEICDLGTPKGLRDRAMWLLGYATAARRRVHINLEITDIRPERGDVLRVFIWRDKGQQNRKPPVGHWGTVRKGRCKDPLCPACAVLEWMDLLAELGVRDGPLFRPIDKGGNVAEAGRPIAGGHDARLAPRGVNAIFKACAVRAGLPPNVTPHSLRAGFATEGYELGADGLALRRHGGWADDSTAFNEYIREVDDERHSPLHAVAARRRKGQS